MSERPAKPVTTYRAFQAAAPRRERIRARIRNMAITFLAVPRSVPTTNWIRFPYYHHVFDDERAGFEAHLRWMKNVADPISLDDAVSALDGEGRLDGRYFCVTFDDGYRECVTNALPILAEQEVPATFFVPTAFIGATAAARDQALVGRIGAYDRSLTNFLTWDDCRQLATAGMTVGSHGVTHRRLIDLPPAEVAQELSESKETITRQLGVECRHFSCPKGRLGVDFVPERDPVIAARAGYRSFSTTARGTVRERPHPMLIPRDHVIASWSTHQLRYFFSR